MAANNGMLTGWIAPTLLKLLAKDTPIPVTSSQISWLVSLIDVGNFVGSILATIAIDKIGRKKSLVLAAIPMMLASITFTCATDVQLLYVGRFLSGLGAGASRSTIFLYISEIASPSIRGKLSSILYMLINGGVVIEFILGSYLPIRMNSSLLAVPALLFMLTFIFAPESPYFHLMKDDLKSARRSLEVLRNTKYVEEELNELEMFVQADRHDRQGIWDLVRVETNRKSLFKIFGLITLLKFSGVSILLSYCQVIFEQVHTTTSAEVNSILVVSSIFLSSWISVKFIDIWGRKPLFLLSCNGVSISLFCMGLYFYFKDHNFPYLEQLAYLPVLSLVVSKVFEGLGFGLIKQIFVMELFPTDVKATAVCVSRIFQSLASFIVIQFYQLIVDNYSQYVIFWIFAFCAIFSGIYVLSFLPETKNKSLSEIQADLKNNSNNKK